MKLEDLHDYLNEVLKVNQFRDYCPNGLQVSGKDKIKKVAFSVSATIESIQQAVKWKADALIVHHGIIWNHDGAQVIQGPLKHRIQLLLENNINLLAYHLPLDAHLEFGNAAKIAQAIGLKNVSNFGEYKGSFVGVKGELPKKLSASQLTAIVEKLLDKKVIMADCLNKNLQNIAIVTGAGANYYKNAFEEKQDALITGEMSEYHWHGAKELGITIFAGGHHATERFGVLALEKLINEKFRLQTMFFDSDNPI